MSRITFGMLEAGCIPGDLRAFKKEGGKIRLYKGGGDAPTSQTITQTSIPEYMRPYVEEYLGKAKAVADLGYQPYGGQRIAEFDPFQLQAQQNVANMQTAGQLGSATQMAGLAGLRAGDMKYDPTGFSYQSVNAPKLNQYQMQRPEDVSTGKFIDPNMMQQYMSPYQQAVTDIDKREAMRQSNIMQQQQQARAVQQGAFGGSGSVLTEAARQRNLSEQMGDIQTRGSQAAFQQGAQQFQMDQQRALQAAMANQQMGFGTGQQNLAAQLGVQQLGAQQGMQAQLANQQMGLETQRLGEQSRQFGANLGLQGIQQQLAAAGLLGNLGQMEFGQQKDIINALNAAGAQRQGLEQGRLDMNYQDFLRQQDYPYRQIGFMFDAFRGLPLAQYSQSTYAGPMTTGQAVTGAALGYQAGKDLKFFTDGGAVNESRGSGLGAIALRNLG
jgi:hypothetical protein